MITASFRILLAVFLFINKFMNCWIIILNSWTEFSRILTSNPINKFNSLVYSY